MVLLLIKFFVGLILVFAIGYLIGHLLKLNVSNVNSDIKDNKNIKEFNTKDSRPGAFNVEDNNINEPEFSEKWKE